MVKVQKQSGSGIQLASEQQCSKRACSSSPSWCRYLMVDTSRALHSMSFSATIPSISGVSTKVHANTTLEESPHGARSERQPESRWLAGCCQQMLQAASWETCAMHLCHIFSRLHTMHGHESSRALRRTLLEFNGRISTSGFGRGHSLQPRGNLIISL